MFKLAIPKTTKRPQLTTRLAGEFSQNGSAGYVNQLRCNQTEESTPMPLAKIQVPADLNKRPFSEPSENAIDQAHEAIERFMLADVHFFDNFVNCDFHLVDQAISWVVESHLMAGNRFLEFGSGFGAATILASIHGMEAAGIEIEQPLVDEANQLADQLGVKADFYCGSFVPRDIEGYADLAAEVEHVDTSAGEVYEQMDSSIADFDLVFAFPWPGENGFFESVFERTAAQGALFMTYNGIEGIHLHRKE